MDSESVAPVGDPEPAPPEKKNVAVSMTPDQVVAATGGTKGDTSYVLLVKSEKGNDGWSVAGTYNARDPEAAIKAYAETLPGIDGSLAHLSFVAVAAKFWRPVTPKIEVVTTKTITLGPAS